MPQILPRLREFGFNFGFLAYLIAYLFSITNLIPTGHSYLDAKNINRFGIRDVLTEAYSRIVWSRKNIDQIVLFILIALGFVLVLGQLGALLVSVLAFSGTAFAAGVTGFFVTTPPDFDIAFIMMDRVFGVPNIFDSCIEQGIACAPGGTALPAIPWPFHTALHAVLKLYSEAMLLVAMFIIFYYMFVVVVETAQTGTPFGRRFATFYVPLRLILAITLLLPLANGINTGQYLLLNVAKWGSSFGTNGWKIFNISLINTVGMSADQLIIKPNSPDSTNLVQFYHLAHSCRAAYQRVYGKTINPYLYNSTATAGVSTFAAAQTFYGPNMDIRIVFGEQNATIHNEFQGNIRPYCGEVVLQVDSTNSLSVQVSNAYFNLMTGLWGNTNLVQMADKIAEERLGGAPTVACPAVWGGGCTGVPPTAWIGALIQTTQVALEAQIETILSPANLAIYTGFDYDPNHLDRGWGGAGLWFNKIAEINGAIVTAVHAKPYGTQVPEIMEHVAAERQAKAPSLFMTDKYRPQLPEGSKEKITWKAPKDNDIAGHLHETYSTFLNDSIDPTPDEQENANGIGTVLSMIFGADGLFNLRENSDVHPLAQMAGLGKSIMESAIQNIGIGLTLSLGGGAMSAAGNSQGAAASGLSGTFIAIGTIALTTGFLLYYILPFLPFIYFFFAVGKWVKAIFEAMVAIPLWALAHLKIDGDGIPGAAAKNGYILLLEIFLRPILTVFGMIAAVSIFTALAMLMNDLFELVTSNLSGYDQYASAGVYSSGAGAPIFMDIEYYRSGVDQFFFTLLYAVLIYIMATANFKLIDLVPNQILRWIGEGVESFGDKAEDAADNLIRYAAIGGGMLGGELTSSLREGAQGMGQLAGSAIKK